jgi:multimeric flavodoxin WrbA
MKILGINGSPHAQGNSAYALSYALQVCEQLGAATEIIHLEGKHIEPCEGSFACRCGECIYDDDMTAICEALRRCDGLLLSSPVYMGLVTRQMKVLMDRSVVLRVGGPFAMSGKVGGGIACGGFRNGGQELTLQCMHTFFLQHDMLAISDGPRFSHSGAAVVGQAAEDAIGLQTVQNLAERMVKALRDRRS